MNPVVFRGAVGGSRRFDIRYAHEPGSVSWCCGPNYKTKKFNGNIGSIFDPHFGGPFLPPFLRNAVLR